MATNSKVSDALAIARSVLGDDIGLQWTDIVLMPKVVQAHSELVSKLILNGVSVEIKTTSRLTLTSPNTTLGGSSPTDIIRVIELHEVAPTDSINNAVPMRKVDIIPNMEQSSTLRYWCYNMESLTFLGATVDRDVIISYYRQPSAPVEVNSFLDFNLSEIYIGPRVAALCTITKDPALFQTANQMAEENLSRIVRIQVKGDQNLPVRRRPFSYMTRRGIRR